MHKRPLKFVSIAKAFTEIQKNLGILKNIEDSVKYCSIDTLILLHHLA